MDILEFIETQYPITQKILGRLEDPYKRIDYNDDLPYDRKGPDENGVITKLVELDDERVISVMELIGLTKEEVDASDDLALKIVWENYMNQIDLEDLNILDILSSVKQYQKVTKSKEEKLGVLSL